MNKEKTPPKYPDFGHRFTKAMTDAGVKSKDIEDELGCSDEAVRLWRGGYRMPTPARMKRLAKMLGVSVALLRDGEQSANELVPGAMVITLDDERWLVETYRNLKPWAQESLRKRAAQLHEDFGVKGRNNPFGQGAPNRGGTQ